MTAPDLNRSEAQPLASARIEAAAAAPSAQQWRRWLVFGTGFGIAIGAKNLEAVIVRSRASGPAIAGSATISDFRTRPAGEWGAELMKVLAEARENHLAATLLLPREEVIVRTLQLPGVADKDIPAAIQLQVETLHPYGDEEVAWAWSRAGRDSVFVGLLRKALLDSYETLFSEAGIGLAAVTFSSAAIHAALRIWSAAPASILCSATDERGRTEVYGESEARPVYSAEFSIPCERALGVARAELRLAPDYPARSLEEELPRASGSGGAISALAYAAGLVGSAHFVARIANLLPRERRVRSARRQYLLPATLMALLAIGAITAFVIIPAIEQRRYLADLNAEIHRIEPAAARAQALEKRINASRLRIAALDDLRGRNRADLDILNELTRILPPPVWTNSIEIFPDNVVIAGEADQAAPLLKTLDSSPLFQNSEFALSVTRNGATQTEQFRIKTMRRNRIGRTTP
jgi:Tfp pilus assembly protein PilN